MPIISVPRFPYLDIARVSPFRSPRVASCRKRLISIQSGRIARNNRAFRLIKKLAIIIVAQRNASRDERIRFSQAGSTMTDASLIERRQSGSFGNFDR